jgi:hypothetical protein
MLDIEPIQSTIGIETKTVTCVHHSRYQLHDIEMNNTNEKANNAIRKSKIIILCVSFTNFEQSFSEAA